MFLKKKIEELAPTAVLVAEKTFGKGKGTEKKAFAIKFILKLLPLPNFLNPLLEKVLAFVLDEAIEFALDTIKNS